jgi:4-hydroxy-4-methyl-2-oxoglutarate aldolase
VKLVQSPRADESVLGSEAAESMQSAGVIGAVVDGAVRDLEGLMRLGFACWCAGRTQITGRWRIEAVAFGEPVAICGVQVQQGDVVVADDGGVVFVPADRFEELARRLVENHRQ